MLRTTPPDRKIRLAIVGCGRIANSHFEAAKHHAEDIELVAVCDPDPPALDRAKERTGAAGFTDLDALLASSDAELIALCTPSGLHSAQTLRCASARRHIMTEKPMATRWHDGTAMVHACDEADVQLFVVKQNRHNPTLQLLRRAVRKGRFGRIYMVQVNVFWSRPQSYYDSAQWRGTWEFDGGALMNQASHYVDLLDWVIGPVQCVQAMTGTLARNIEVEDTAVMNLQWRSGALGTMSVNMLTYPRNIEGSITIMGEKGTVRLSGVAVNRFDHWEFADPDPDDAEVDAANYQTTSVYGHGHLPYYGNVISTLRGQTRAETDGREGLRSLELLIAAYLSARDGRKVALPLEY
jgi:UDP-N-acetyl-2-amino-2-deoxyglucuronate dehydrogenase